MDKGTITWLSLYDNEMPVGEELLFWIQGTFLKGKKLHDGYKVFFADGAKYYGLVEIHNKYTFTHFAYIPPPPETITL